VWVQSVASMLMDHPIVLPGEGTSIRYKPSVAPIETFPTALWTGKSFLGARPLKSSRFSVGRRT
jgi:hypothetical protein